MKTKFRVVIENIHGKEDYGFAEFADALALFLKKYNEDNDAKLTLSCNADKFILQEPKPITVVSSKTGPKVVRHDKCQPRLKLEGVGNPVCPLYDKHVRISGTFDQIGKSRDEVLDAIQQLGSKYACTEIIKGMDVVVLGNNYGPSKEVKIKKWQDEGCNITVLSQFDLKKIFDEFLPKL